MFRNACKLPLHMLILVANLDVPVDTYYLCSGRKNILLNLVGFFLPQNWNIRKHKSHSLLPRAFFFFGFVIESATFDSFTMSNVQELCEFQHFRLPRMQFENCGVYHVALEYRMEFFLSNMSVIWHKMQAHHSTMSWNWLCQYSDSQQSYFDTISIRRSALNRHFSLVHSADLFARLKFQIENNK